MKSNYISISIILIIFAEITSQLISLFQNYVFYRINIDRDTLLISLWILPFIASLLATIYAKKYKLLISLTFGFFAILMTISSNLLLNLLGYQVDFEGLYGAIDMFQISFFINIPIALLASLVGFLLIPTLESKD